MVDFYSLFDFLQARIHPEQSAASLSKENYGNLHKSIKEVRDLTSCIESLLVPVPVLFFNFFFIFPRGEYALFIANIEDEYLQVIEYAVQVDADSIQFPGEWLFHFRWGKKPGKVNGKKLETYVVILTRVYFTGYRKIT